MKRLYILLTIFALFASLLLAGCGMRALLTSRSVSNNDWPKKRVMVMPATDLTGISLNKSIVTISNKLTRNLEKTGSFNLYSRNKTKKSYPFTPGKPIDPELLKEAKEAGINAIIFETLNPIELNPGKSGIWPFRKKAWKCTVSMNIDILDVNMGTILLSEEVADNITLSREKTLEETEKGGNTETKEKALRECLPDILEEAANAASLSLNQSPWTGRIVSTATKEIIINAGSDAGLSPGVVLEVFQKVEYITSFNKQTYPLPGKKAGEIRIVRIKQRHSFAKPVKEGDFKPGQIIRVKD